MTANRWDKSAAEINRLIPLLTDGNLDVVREKLKKLLRAEAAK
jgi:hypothetical protein